MPTQTTINRIMENYEPIPVTGCWIWMGPIGSSGYPHVDMWYKNKRKTIGATRLAYERAFGQIPKGLFICHKCDIPSCINPAHLFSATAKENSIDMANKGRATTGSVKKLTKEDLAEISLSHDPPSAIAKSYGISSRYARKLKERILHRS